MKKVTALKRVRYNGVLRHPNDQFKGEFEARPKDAKLLVALQRVRYSTATVAVEQTKALTPQDPGKGKEEGYLRRDIRTENVVNRDVRSESDNREARRAKEKEKSSKDSTKEPAKSKPSESKAGE